MVSFEEKPSAEGGLINGGFFVLEPTVLERIEGDDTVWEKEPMESLAADAQLAAWVHRGFWQPMDTLSDKQYLNSLWESGDAPWKLWEGYTACDRWLGLGTLPRLRRPACGDDGGFGDAARLERLHREPMAECQRERRYPLRAKVCEACKLVQLDYDVAPQELFGNYVYFSSYSDDWLAHAKAYCEMARKRFALGALEPRGRTGQQRRLPAEEFPGHGHCRCWASILRHRGAAAEKIGVPTLIEFFGRELAPGLGASKDRGADLIIANNVLAHVPRLNDFVAGIALLLFPTAASPSSSRIFSS